MKFLLITSQNQNKSPEVDARHAGILMRDEKLRPRDGFAQIDQKLCTRQKSLLSANCDVPDLLHSVKR
ncbi:unnamed protein product [Leptosia nina]|uniref:Uncharacterized protein n=1 Tax=Leptosia nina TaxID=320188 RepID=A0AAV1JUG8_9NEOP